MASTRPLNSAPAAGAGGFTAQLLEAGAAELRKRGFAGTAYGDEGVRALQGAEVGRALRQELAHLQALLCRVVVCIVRVGGWGGAWVCVFAHGRSSYGANGAPVCASPDHNNDNACSH